MFGTWSILCLTSSLHFLLNLGQSSIWNSLSVVRSCIPFGRDENTGQYLILSVWSDFRCGSHSGKAVKLQQSAISRCCKVLADTWSHWGKTSNLGNFSIVNHRRLNLIAWFSSLSVKLSSSQFRIWISLSAVSSCIPFGRDENIGQSLILSVWSDFRCGSHSGKAVKLQQSSISRCCKVLANAWSHWGKTSNLGKLSIFNNWRLNSRYWFSSLFGKLSFSQSWIIRFSRVVRVWY